MPAADVAASPCAASVSELHLSSRSSAPNKAQHSPTCHAVHRVLEGMEPSREYLATRYQEAHHAVVASQAYNSLLSTLQRLARRMQDSHFASAGMSPSCMSSSPVTTTAPILLACLHTLGSDRCPAAVSKACTSSCRLASAPPLVPLGASLPSCSSSCSCRSCAGHQRMQQSASVQKRVAPPIRCRGPALWPPLHCT